MFEEKYVRYGVVKVWNGLVEVYSSNQERQTLSYPSIVVNAYWAGNGIITVDRDGVMHRWSSFRDRERLY
ncbi:MAG: hypothetical protein K5660_02840 [Paludibacteraceae bacterium]|nr:hypothetical protein [Paludibacteraceae bacterium]